jgi:hypothetical protein
LAADLLGDDEATQDVHQQLKVKIVGRLPQDSWSLTEDQLRQAIQDIQQRGQGSSGRPRHDPPYQGPMGVQPSLAGRPRAYGSRRYDPSMSSPRVLSGIPVASPAGCRTSAGCTD